MERMFISPLLPPANEVWGKVMFSQVYVHTGEGVLPVGGSAFGGGGSASGGWGLGRPPTRTRKAGRPLENRAVCLLECFFVLNYVGVLPSWLLVFHHLPNS